jgi:hypothetical protein
MLRPVGAPDSAAYVVRPGGTSVASGHAMEHTAAERSFWASPSGIAFLVFLAVAVFFLVTEHTAHVLGALPYLLLLACPLMHLLHHRGHHHGGAHDHGPHS